MGRGQQRAEEEVGSPGAVVTDGCEPSDMGARNEPWSSGRATSTFHY